MFQSGIYNDTCTLQVQVVVGGYYIMSKTCLFVMVSPMSTMS